MGQAACGGPWRNAVYDAAALADNVEVPAGAYKGCYADDAANSFAVLRNVGSYGDNYGEDARFSISFWFTHNYCTNEETMGNWETLFSTKIIWCSEEDVGCNPAEVWIGLTCHANSTITGSNNTVLRTIMRDDGGKSAQFDVAVGGDDTPDRAGGLITKSWVHFALVLDKSQVGAYIDGAPVTRYGFIRSPTGGTAGEDNLAWHNRGDTNIETVSQWRDDGMIQLRNGGFSSFNFTSTYGTSASIGFVHGPWGGSYFDGYMANIGIFRRPLAAEEVRCLYRYGETHLSLPPKGDSGR